MTSKNKLAIIGHRGWAATPITRALAEASAHPVRILHRHGSDITQLPANTEAVPVALDDEDSLTKAVSDIDICM